MEELKKRICRSVDNNRESLLSLADRIWKKPELGYNEFNTASIVSSFFEELKIPFRDKIAVTGCQAVLDTGKPGPTIALLGELDALYLPAHKEADKETGAAHVCGHHLQIVALLGAARALMECRIEEHAGGRIVFISVPSEEFAMDDYRRRLRQEGRIEFYGGKQEMISLGIFDDIDAAVALHADCKFHYPLGHNGFVCKRVVFKGKAAHAGGQPEKGINALYAAEIAMSGINAQRETFRDEDSVRVHCIISNGGGVVNIIPDTVEMEVQVRARSIEAIKDAAAKVDRSVCAGAMAMGAQVEIETAPGYMPLRNSDVMAQAYVRSLAMLDPSVELEKSGHRASSTDMGDVSCIMPILQIYSAGVPGPFHAVDFRIDDVEKACIEPAKLLAMTALDLLKGDKIEADYRLMSRQEYLSTLRSFADTKRFDYTDYPRP